MFWPWHSVSQLPAVMQQQTRTYSYRIRIRLPPNYPPILEYIHLSLPVTGTAGTVIGFVAITSNNRQLTASRRLPANLAAAHHQVPNFVSKLSFANKTTQTLLKSVSCWTMHSPMGSTISLRSRANHQAFQPKHPLHTIVGLQHQKWASTARDYGLCQGMQHSLKQLHWEVCHVLDLLMCQ